MVWNDNGAPPPNGGGAAMRPHLDHSGGLEIPSIDPSNPFLSSGMTRENQELSRRKAEHMEALEHIAPQHGFGDYNSLRASRLTDKTLREYFHLPLSDVAKKFGMCTTAFKKLCRKEGIMQWPYRTLRSLEKKMASLRAEQKFTHDQFLIEDQISKLQQKREAILAGTGLSSLSEDDISSPSHIPSDDSSTSGSTSSINSAERSCSTSPKPAQLMSSLALNEPSNESKEAEERKKYRRMVSMNDMDRYELKGESNTGGGSNGGGGGGSKASRSAGMSGPAPPTNDAPSAAPPGRKGASQPPPAASSGSSGASNKVKRSTSFDFAKGGGGGGAERPPFGAGGALYHWPQHGMMMARPGGEGAEGGFPRVAAGYGMHGEAFGQGQKGRWPEDPAALQQRCNDLIAENMSLRGVIRSMALEREQLARRSHSEEAALAKYQVKSERLEEEILQKESGGGRGGGGGGGGGQGARGATGAEGKGRGKGGAGAAAQRGRGEKGQRQAGGQGQEAGPRGGGQGPRGGAQGPKGVAPQGQAGLRGVPPGPIAGMGVPQGQGLGLGQGQGYAQGYAQGYGHPHGMGAHPTPQQLLAAHGHDVHGMEDGHIEMEFDGGQFLQGDEGFLPGSPSGMELWTDNHEGFGV